MPQITRRLEFDAGHRVLGHEGKCRYLHGHRYVAEITVEAAGLDSLGRVVDFSVIKARVGGWLDEMLDHNVLLNPQDPLLNLAVVGQVPARERSPTTGEVLWCEMPDVFGGREPFVMPDGNPTAENLAELIYHKAVELLEPCGIRVTRIRLYETPNSWADHCPPRS